MKANSIFFCALMLICQNGWSQARANFETQSHTLQVQDGSKRHAILTVPRSQGKFPAVLFIGGIGSFSLDDSDPAAPESYLAIVNAMARNQMVTLRVEKSGIGGSEGPGCENDSLSGELANYRAGLAYLKTLPNVDADKIILAGHSMGGVFAPLLAAETPVRGVIAIATLGQSWRSYEVENAKRQMALAGNSPEEIATAVAKLQEYQKLFHDEKLSFADILAKRPDLKDVVGFPMSESYLRELAALDILSVWKKVSGKVLLIHGKADFLSSAQDHERIAEVINSAGHGSAKHLEVPQLDHFFWTSKDESESFKRAGQGGDGAVLNSGFFRELADDAEQMSNGR